MPDVDDLDRRVLNALLVDGRAALADLATTVDADRADVAATLDRLAATGACPGVSPRIDPPALGHPVGVLLQLSVVPAGVDRVVADLVAHPRVAAVYEVTGDHDVVALCWFPSEAAFESAIATLRVDDAVRAVHPARIDRTVRDRRPFPLDADG
jgi:DNA-binding Lrp family transcriptional regulator